MVRWSSWHLHTRGEGQAILDRMIIEVVAPAAGLIERRLGLRPWFFMRYWQGGPHVRLRVSDASPELVEELEELLGRELRTVEDSLPADQLIDRESYRAGAEVLAAGGEGGTALAVEELLEPGVHRARYEPELERYGGPELIASSERLFWISSRLALAALVRGLPREGLALEALASIGAALGGPPARLRFARGARDSWLEWAENAAEAASGEPVDELALRTEARALAARIHAAGQGQQILETRNAPVAQFGAALAAAAERWHPPEPILASHAHMFLNRLGLGPAQELLLHSTLVELLEARLR